MPTERIDYKHKDGSLEFKSLNQRRAAEFTDD